MSISLILPALLAQSAVTPLTDVHKRDLSCVAAFAIVASEQGRGAKTALEFPPLSERGKTYAGIVGERVMKETGQSREQVKAAVIEAVAMHQREAMASNDPTGVVEAAMGGCLPMLNTEVPAAPNPTLPQCAAMVTLAYEEVYGREGLSKTAKDLKTLASVLDSRAREELTAKGLSGNERDKTMVETREKLMAESKAKEASGQSSDLDFDYCFAQAAPKDQTPKEH